MHKSSTQAYRAVKIEGHVMHFYTHSIYTIDVTNVKPVGLHEKRYKLRFSLDKKRRNIEKT